MLGMGIHDGSAAHRKEVQVVMYQICSTQCVRGRMLDSQIREAMF